MLKMLVVFIFRIINLVTITCWFFPDANRIFVRKHESIMLSALKICILKRGTTISYRLIEPEKGERMFSDLNLLIFDKLTLKAFCFRGGRQQGEWPLFIRNRV